MKALTLPVILNPISRRKDKSCMLKFDTRELTAPETLALMQLENSEGWLMFAPNQEELDLGDIPEQKAELDTKSPSERLRTRIFIHYKQATKDGSYVGLFETFYKDQMEKIIEGYSKKNIKDDY